MKKIFGKFSKKEKNSRDGSPSSQASASHPGSRRGSVTIINGSQTDLQSNNNNNSKVTEFLSNYVKNPKELSKIHKAAWSGDLKSMEKLVIKENSPLDKKNRTPMHYACARGHAEIVNKLLEYGAKCNLADNDHCTPLMIACKSGSLACVELLLKQSADLTCVDNQGEAAIHLATRYKNTNILHALIRSGCDVNTLTKNSKTCLIIAVEEKNVPVANELIKLQSNIHHKLPDGRTAIDISKSLGIDSLLDFQEQTISVIKTTTTATSSASSSTASLQTKPTTSSSQVPVKHKDKEDDDDDDEEEDEEDNEFSSSDVKMKKSSSEKQRQEDPVSWASDMDSSSKQNPVLTAAGPSKLKVNLKNLVEKVEAGQSVNIEPIQPIQSSPPRQSTPKKEKIENKFSKKESESIKPTPVPPLSARSEDVTEMDDETWMSESESIPHLPKSKDVIGLLGQPTTLSTSNGQNIKINSPSKETLALAQQEKVNGKENEDEEESDWDDQEDSESVKKINAKPIKSMSPDKKTNDHQIEKKSKDGGSNALKLPSEQKKSSNAISPRQASELMATPRDISSISNWDSSVDEADPSSARKSGSAGKLKGDDSDWDSNDDTELLSAQENDDSSLQNEENGKKNEQQEGMLTNRLDDTLSTIDEESCVKTVTSENRRNIEEKPTMLRQQISDTSMSEEEWQSEAAADKSADHSIKELPNSKTIIKQKIQQMPAEQVQEKESTGIDQEIGKNSMNQETRESNRSSTQVGQVPHKTDPEEMDYDTSMVTQPAPRHRHKRIKSSGVGDEDFDSDSSETNFASGVVSVTKHDPVLTTPKAAYILGVLGGTKKHPELEEVLYSPETLSGGQHTSLPQQQQQARDSSTPHHSDHSDSPSRRSVVKFAEEINDVNEQLTPLRSSSPQLAWQQKINDLSSSLKKERTVRAVLENKVDNLQRSRDMLQSRTDQLTHENAQLEMRRKELESYLQNLEYKLSNEGDRNSGMEVALNRLREQLKKQEELFQTEQVQRRKVEMELRSQQIECQTLTVGIKQIEEERNDLHKLVNELRNEQMRLESVLDAERFQQSRLIISEGHIDNHEETMRSIQPRKSLQESILSKSVSDSYDNMTTYDFDTMKTELDRCRTRLREERAQWLKENHDLQTIVEQLQHDLAINQDALSQATVQYTVQINQFKTEIATLNSALQQTEAINLDLDRNLKLERSRTDEILAELQEIQFKMKADSEKQIDSNWQEWNEKLQLREQDLEEMKNINLVLREKVSSAENKLVLFESEIQDLNFKLQDKQRELESLQSLCEQLRLHEQKWRDKCNKVENEKQASNALVDGLQERIEDFRDNNERMHRYLENLLPNSINSLSTNRQLQLDDFDSQRQKLIDLFEIVQSNKTILAENPLVGEMSLKQWQNTLTDSGGGGLPHTSLDDANKHVEQLQELIRQLQAQNMTALESLNSTKSRLDGGRQDNDIVAHKAKIAQSRHQRRPSLEGRAGGSSQSQAAELKGMLQQMEKFGEDTERKLGLIEKMKYDAQNMGNNSNDIISDKLIQNENEGLNKVEDVLRDHGDKMEKASEATVQLTMELTRLNRYNKRLKSKLDQVVNEHSISEMRRSDLQSKYSEIVQERERTDELVNHLNQSIRQNYNKLARGDERTTQAFSAIQDTISVMQDKIGSCSNEKIRSSTMNNSGGGGSGTMATSTGSNNKIETFHFIENHLDHLNQQKKQLEEEFKSYRAFVSNNFLSKEEFLKLHKELEERSRQEVSEKLIQVNKYLSEQAEHLEHIDKVRDETEMKLKQDLQVIQTESRRDVDNWKEHCQRIQVERDRLKQDQDRLEELLQKERKERVKLTKKVNRLNEENAAAHVQLSLERERNLVNASNHSLSPNPMMINEKLNNGYFSSSAGVYNSGSTPYLNYTTSTPFQPTAMSSTVDLVDTVYAPPLSRHRSPGGVTGGLMGSNTSLAQVELLHQKLKAELDRSISKHLEAGKATYGNQVNLRTTFPRSNTTGIHYPDKDMKKPANVQSQYHQTIATSYTRGRAAPLGAYPLNDVANHP